MGEPRQPKTRAGIYGERDLVMHSHRLDNLDLKILDQLQKHGRISNVDLAEKVGISAPPCLRRRATLERQGYIRGYSTILNPKKLGFDVEAFVSVQLFEQRTGDVHAFEQKVKAWREVRECYALSGSVDFLLKCVAADLNALQHFVTSVLIHEALVTAVLTSVVVRTTKNEPGVPIEQYKGQVC